MTILSRKSEALLKYERCQDRVAKLKRSLAEAVDLERAAGSEHEAALAELHGLPEANTIRIAGNLELIQIGPVKARVEESANVLAARSTVRSRIESDARC